jgi:autotransporter adhesin
MRCVLRRETSTNQIRPVRFARQGNRYRDTRSVAATEAALANLPQAPNPGQSMINMSMGTSHGEVGLAAGGSYCMPDNSIIIKASASYSGEAGMTGGWGVGFVLN